MSDWAPEAIAFAEDATAYGSYFERLRGIVCAGLAPGSLVCDAGCGLGQLAVEMARAGMAVDAVDCSPQAARAARQRAEQAGRLARRAKTANGMPRPGFVRVREGDFACMADGRAPRYDRMVFSLSESAQRAFDIARRAGAAQVVVVNKIHPAHAPEDAKRPIVYNMERAVGELCALGMETYATDVVLRFDQPFRTLADARRFFALFRTRAYPHGIGDDALRAELTPTGRDDFPWALPIRRHLACFRIDLAAAANGAGAQMLDRYFAEQGGRMRRAS